MPAGAKINDMGPPSQISVMRPCWSLGRIASALQRGYLTRINSQSCYGWDRKAGMQAIARRGADFEFNATSCSR